MPSNTQVLTGAVRGGRIGVRDTRLRVSGAAVTDLDLSGTVLASFTAVGSTFDRCDFRRAVLRHGSLGVAPQCVYRDCHFDDADLRGTPPGLARFERCRFAGTRLEKWLCLTAEFVDCRFAGRIAEVVFRGQVLPSAGAATIGRERNEFTGNDFRDAELIGVAFVAGIDLTEQHLPTGPQYLRIPDAPARIAAVRAQVQRWPDEAERSTAGTLLDFYSRRGYEQQRELFVRRDSLARLVPEHVRERLWDALLATGG